MFGFLCAQCGQMEILHRNPSELEENATSGLWPDLEYQEDAPLRQGEVMRPFFKRKRSYRFSLLACPGFRYRHSERRNVVERFAEVALTDHWVADFLPEWRDELAARIEELEAAQAAHDQKNREWDLEGGAMVYIVYDTRSGASSCYYR